MPSVFPPLKRARRSIEQVAQATGLSLGGARARLARGLRGAALFAPPDPGKQRGGRVRPGDTFDRTKVDLTFTQWLRVLEAAELLGMTRAAAYFGLPPRALRAVLLGNYAKVDCLREHLQALPDEEKNHAVEAIAQLAARVPTTGRC